VFLSEAGNATADETWLIATAANTALLMGDCSTLITVATSQVIINGVTAREL